MILTVAAVKGGPGKTTTAVHVAACLAARGSQVMLVDADPQQSAMAWADAADLPFATVTLPIKTLHKQLQAVAPPGTDVVIDTPPGDKAIIASALRPADVVLVPFRPSTADLGQYVDTVALIEEVAAVNDNLVAYFLFTQASTNRNSISLRGARDVLAGEGQNVLDAIVYFREAMTRTHGQPLTDLGLSLYQPVTEELLQKVSQR
jgi:chromosome partitioning protein